MAGECRHCMEYCVYDCISIDYIVIARVPTHLTHRYTPLGILHGYQHDESLARSAAGMGQAFSHRRQSRRNDVLEEAVHTAGAHTVPTSRHSSSASPTSPPCMDRNTCDCNRSSSALTTSRRLSLLVTAFIQDLHLTSRRPLTAAVQALAANPGHAKAWVKLSNFGGGEVREYFVGKKECLERALNADPMYARAWVNLGICRL